MWSHHRHARPIWEVVDTALVDNMFPDRRQVKEIDELLIYGTGFGVGKASVFVKDGCERP